MNKKLFGVVLLLAGVLIFAGVGCGKKNTVDNQKTLPNGASTVLNEINKGKSMIDIAREKGETVVDKLAYLNNCKESDQDMQDYCFSMGAIYYRDASFCPSINNAETRKKCNQKIIDKWYDDLEKGTTPTTPAVPGALTAGGVSPSYDCKKYDSASACKTAMKNGMLMACAQNMPQVDKDSCFTAIALQFKDVTYCDRVSDSEKKDECKKSIETLNNIQPDMIKGIVPGLPQ